MSSSVKSKLIKTRCQNKFKNVFNTTTLLYMVFTTLLWSSYRKLAWGGFEPTTTEFHSDTLTDWAIRPWFQLEPRVNFVQQLQFHCLFSVTFYFGYCLHQLPRCLMSFVKLIWTYQIFLKKSFWISFYMEPLYLVIVKNKS